MREREKSTCFQVAALVYLVLQEDSKAWKAKDGKRGAERVQR